MPTKHEIILAIGAHIWWKNEFEKSISDGWHFFNPDLAEGSCESDLGFWLAEHAATEPESEHLRAVQSLYADFHEAAVEVARMAASGSIELAEKDIRTGLYARASIALTLGLRDWMGAVKEDESIHGLPPMPTNPPNPNQKPLEG